jgi:hypothetical protein
LRGIFDGSRGAVGEGGEGVTEELAVGIHAVKTITHRSTRQEWPWNRIL